MNFIIVFMLITSVFGETFYDDNKRGWHWYETFQSHPAKHRPSQSTSLKDPATIIASYKQKLESAFAKAWINPTLPNIKAYQNLQKDMLNRSQYFSQIWMTSILHNPELDHTLITPIHQNARHIYLDHEKQLAKRKIQSLSKEYGLFFFFQGRCDYCHAFAPIVKAFSKEYHWNVLAISMDGGSCQEFPKAILDNGLAQTWGVKILPALFAVNPHTGHVIPIAYGMIGLDEIIARLMIINRDKGKN